MDPITAPILDQLSQGSIVNKLVSVATSYLNEQYLWKSNLAKELKKLTRLIPQIQAVVEFSERKTNMTDGALMQWLWHFRDCIDEAEEVLDALEYIELEKKAKRNVNTRLSRAVDASTRFAKRALKLEDVLEKLRECVENLSSMAQSARDFLVLIKDLDDSGKSEKQFHPVIKERSKAPLPALTLLKELEEKKKEIIHALIEEPKSKDTPNVLVLPLVGMDGMGKTTLAQQVYRHFEDEKVYFDIRIWIFVSTDFNVVSHTERILKSLGQHKSYSKSDLGILQREIIKKLHSRRFLIVLDDVGNDIEQDDWERFCIPFRNGQKGSRILFTTELDTVVQMVEKVMKGWSMKKVDLSKISDDGCKEIFYHYAFGNEDLGKHPALTSVGNKINLKLKGRPLLAKIIGGVLSSTLDLEHWQRVLKSEIWKRPLNSRDDFIPALKQLCYNMLSPHLKRCFAYCSIFPKDHVYERQALVNMWIAAGLIRPQQPEDSEEDMAKQCFDLLCRKSFFEHNPDMEDCYVMHDMLHELASHVSRHECCRIMHEKPRYIPGTIRHLSITSTLDQLPARTKMVSELRHLRTLIIDYHGHAQKLHDFIQEACASPKSIRVLVIRFDGNGNKSSDKKWLNNISKMVNLRLLALQGITISSKVLKSVCRFYFLQVSDVGTVPLNVELPSGMNKLINLKNLYGFNGLDYSNIIKIGNLTSLQELLPYRVGTKKGQKIDELRNMNDLCRLEITDLHNVKSKEEANNACLHMKKNLTSLELSWGHRETSNKEVLEALISPPKIEELKIENYIGAPWTSSQFLRHLKSLEIFECPDWKELPPLWELPCLQHLKLEYMDAVTRFGPEASNNEVDKPLFPSLETLSISSFLDLQEWDEADNYTWFPQLRYLKIKYCPKLNKMPSLPSSLKELSIKSVGLMSLPQSRYDCDGQRTEARSFRELQSLQLLRISSCLKTQFTETTGQDLFPSSLKELKIVGIQGLTSLSQLSLCSCPGMADLRTLELRRCADFASLEGLCQITSLEMLEIDDCPKLFEEHHCANNRLPGSLTHLRFIECNVSHESLSQCLQGLTSLDTLEISDCRKMLSLPMAEHLYHLATIKEMIIVDCNELKQLESLEALTSLESLEIRRCPKLCSLTSSIEQPPTSEHSETRKGKGTLHSLKCLIIDNISYLPNLPPSNSMVSISVRSYWFDDESCLPEFNSIPNEIMEWLSQGRESLQRLELGKMLHLQTLPEDLKTFSSLKYLKLDYAPELKSLPMMPDSLESLCIGDCSPRLKKRCQENIGDDWPNIKHIPMIQIYTYECDKSQNQGAYWNFTGLCKSVCSRN